MRSSSMNEFSSTMAKLHAMRSLDSSPMLVTTNMDKKMRKAVRRRIVPVNVIRPSLRVYELTDILQNKEST
jgi:hypothetical protein